MNLNLIATQLAGVDLSDIEARKVELQKRIVAIDEAVERGRKRSMELSRRLADIQSSRRNGRAEAETLLAGEDFKSLLTNEQSIQGERDALAAGVRALSRDAEALRIERGNVEHEARQRLGGAMDIVVAEMEAEALSLAARLAQLFADARTIEHATRSISASRLCLALDYAVNGLAGGKLIPRCYLTASPDLVASLEKNKGAVHIAGSGIHTKFRSSLM